MEEMNKMEEQKQSDWLEQEQKELPAVKTFDKLPSVKFEENKIKTLDIEFANKWEAWKDPLTGKVKAIIPCTEDGIKKNFWLNKLNPMYRELVASCKSMKEQGKTLATFKILQTGSAAKTRYILVK